MAESIPLLEVTNENTTDISEKKTVAFNVGGTVFETYRSTLSQIPSGPLVDNSILTEHFRQERNDFFFDRDPDAFKIVLKTLRSGKITVPAGISDQTLKNELIFWGLVEDMEQQQQQRNANYTETAEAPGINAFYGTSTMNSHQDVRSTGNKIWNTLTDPSSSPLAKLYAGLSYFLMSLSVFILIAETMQEFHHYDAVVSNLTPEEITKYARTPRAFGIIALACCLLFTAEYIIRLVVAPNKLRSVFSFLGIIDLLAILPDFVLLIIDFVATDVLLAFKILRVLYIFRILRLVRIFKHFKNMMETDMFVQTLQSSIGEFVFLFGATAIGVLVWGTLMFYVEDFEASYYGHFRNIMDGCWWAIVTMTTVGYGDLRPMSKIGKTVASLCALSGLILIGLFASVLVNKMIKVSSKREHARKRK